MILKTISYYDWNDDILPAITKNMGINREQFYAWRRLTDPDPTNPMTHPKIFMNYWTLYLELWGKDFNVGKFVTMRYPNDDVSWEQLYEHTTKYGEWAGSIIDGVKKMVYENNFNNNDIIIRFAL